jgi:hypothetical protein
MEISACLPAAPGRCSAHHRDELVVPLLLVVVHEAEKLADAHVVCLRGGGWVSGVEGSGSRQVPNGGRLLWILVFFLCARANEARNPHGTARTDAIGAHAKNEAEAHPARV